ncbi:hypothetical protein TA3x_002690 [Tundrisphaera sp. TA3]|uniref:hypothetical protein n=1 Tax=Tundrisphaera sp. TA3 TaxID=3435775 RepID=UPI003EBFF63E
MSLKLPFAALAMMALAGCSFIHPESRPKGDQVVPASYTGRSGKLVVPRFCKLDTAVVTRPLGHVAIEEAAWRAADEQGVPLGVRQALSANGLRIGVITGGLPPDLSEAFQSRPPQKPTEWVHFDLPEGVQTPVTVRPKVDPDAASGSEVVTLLVNNQGKVEGKDYADASGLITLTADQKGTREVSLRIVPAVQHGPKRGGYAAVQNAGPFAQQEFTFKNEQQEDSRRDLAVTLDIQPGQYVVIGCRSGHERSLGSFLFTRTEANSDQVMQSILLIQAGRNNVGAEPPKPEGMEEPSIAPGASPRPVKEVPQFEARPAKDAPDR